MIKMREGNSFFIQILENIELNNINKGILSNSFNRTLKIRGRTDEKNFGYFI